MSNRTKSKGGRYTPATTPLQRQAKPGSPASDLVACLDSVADMAELRQEVEANLTAAVAAARAAGATWTALGVKLGVSRQSAQERYGKTSPPKGETVFEVRVVHSTIRNDP
jgi:hypothetical protein